MRYIVNQNAVIFSINKEEKLNVKELLSNGQCFVYVDKDKAKKKMLYILDFEDDCFNDETVRIEIDHEKNMADFIIEGDVVKSCHVDDLETEISVFSEI